MGNKETSLADDIDKFDPFIFPEAVDEAEKLRKKLNIGKGEKSKNYYSPLRLQKASQCS